MSICSVNNTKNYSGKLTLSLNWSNAGQSASGNYTDIKLQLYMTVNSSYAKGYGSSNSTFKINGTVVYSGSYRFYPGTVAFGNPVTVRVYHGDTNGYFPGLSCSIYGDSYHFGGNTASGSISGGAVSSFSRPPSSISASNGTLSSSTSYSVSNGVSGATNTVTYNCGGSSGTLLSRGGPGSRSWTPSISLASHNTTGTSLGCTLYVSSYTPSGNYLGQKSSGCTLYIPDNSSTKPSVNTPSITNFTNTVNIDSIQYGIVGKSQLTISTGASGKYGAAIRSYSTTIQGTAYGGSSFTTNILNQVGNFSFYTTAKDSRGFSNSGGSQNFKMLAHSSPVLDNSTTCIRYKDENGKETKNLKFIIKGSYNNIKNTKIHLEYRIKRKNEEWQEGQAWFDLCQPIVGDSVTGPRVSLNKEFLEKDVADFEGEKDIQLRIREEGVFEETAIKNFSITNPFLWNFYKGNKTVKQCFLGNKPIKALYLGNTLFYTGQ